MLTFPSSSSAIITAFNPCLKTVCLSRHRCRCTSSSRRNWGHWSARYAATRRQHNLARWRRRHLDCLGETARAAPFVVCRHFHGSVKRRNSKGCRCLQRCIEQCPGADSNTGPVWQCIWTKWSHCRRAMVEFSLLSKTSSASIKQ